MTSKRNRNEPKNSLFDQFAMSPLGSQSPMRPPEDRGKAPGTAGAYLPGMSPTFNELAAGAQSKRTRQHRSVNDHALPLFSGQDDGAGDLE